MLFQKVYFAEVTPSSENEDILGTNAFRSCARVLMQEAR